MKRGRIIALAFALSLFSIAGANAGTILYGCVTTPIKYGCSLRLFSTWNPSDKSASITLSNGNLTATSTNFSTGDSRATTSHSSGKWIVTFTPSVSVAGGTQTGIGIANSTASLTEACGGSTNQACVVDGTGNFIINSSIIGAGTAIAVGNTVDLAIDLDNKQFWYRVNGGNWNNNVSANPGTNTGGFSMATLAAGPYFVWATWGTTNNGGAETVNFFNTGTWPTGFKPWDQ